MPKRARHSKLAALNAVWEQYRMSHMFPELAGTSTKNLLGELVAALVAQEVQILGLEKKIRALSTRKPVTK